MSRSFLTANPLFYLSFLLIPFAGPPTAFPGSGGFHFYKNHAITIPQIPCLFDIQISRMTEDAVSGRLTVTCEDKVDHLTEFTGRGLFEEGTYCFEVMLETPRSNDSFIYPITADRFWLRYDPEKGTLTIFSLGIYSATLEKGE